MMENAKPPQIQESDVRTALDLTLNASSGKIKGFFDYLKETDPAAYDTLVGEVLSSAQSNGNLDKLESIVQDFLSTKVYTPIVELSDDELVTFLELQQQQVDAAAQAGRQDVCIALFMGKVFEPPLRLAKDLERIELEMMKLQYTSKKSGGEVADNALYETTLSNLTNAVTSQNGQDALSFTTGQGSDLSKQQACSSASIFNNALLNDVPFPDNAHVMRRMYSTQ